MIEWNRLKQEWMNARVAATSAQNEMDQAFEEYLKSGTPAQFKRMQEIIDDLRFLEAEARGRLEQFISENAECAPALGIEM